MKAVDILCRIDRAHDRGFVDVFRWWRLDKDSVDRRIAVQFFDTSEQCILSCVRRQLKLLGTKSEIAAHFVFRPHVGARRWIVADEYNRESGRPAAFFERRNFSAELGVNFFGNRAAFDELRHGAKIYGALMVVPPGS